MKTSTEYFKPVVCVLLHTSHDHDWLFDCFSLKPYLKEFRFIPLAPPPSMVQQGDAKECYHKEYFQQGCTSAVKRQTKLSRPQPSKNTTIMSGQKSCVCVMSFNWLDFNHHDPLFPWHSSPCKARVYIRPQKKIPPLPWNLRKGDFMQKKMTWERPVEKRRICLWMLITLSGGFINKNGITVRNVYAYEIKSAKTNQW